MTDELRKLTITKSSPDHPTDHPDTVTIDLHEGATLTIDKVATRIAPGEGLTQPHTLTVTLDDVVSIELDPDEEV